jgi:muramoyltetrapeptide carboxypeptidase
MIKPPKLKPGATIGIVSPSYHINEDVYKQTVQIFIERGFNIIEGKSVRLANNLFSGTPAQRAQDIMDMFTNSTVDAIVCARGGYGANRVVPLLDYDIIQQNPKIFMGYSDITAYLASITQKTGLVTFQGPMLVTYKNGFIEYNFSYFLKTLTGDSPITILPPKDLRPRILKNGKAKGPLWGGNLCLLVNRLGTPGQLNSEGTILFIEDIGEQHYRFDRMMVHMQDAGMFDNINGLIIGELVDMEDTDPSFGKSTDEIVMDICGDMDIPIITNFPCGHGKYQVTLPISIPVELNANLESPTLTILESPVY